MSENVIILGAGASFSAGIPMLGTFVETMIGLHESGFGPNGALSAEDREILAQAMEIRERLETYHARVAIDQFNLEQILSVLSFDAYVGGSEAAEDLDVFSKAISRTIELTCNVKHGGQLNMPCEDGPAVYRNFWAAIFSLYGSRLAEVPTIISFNYDLVLELALLQATIGPKWGGSVVGSRAAGFQLDYQNPLCNGSSFEFKRATWTTADRNKGIVENPGFILEPSKPAEGFMRIPFYKLHGSLNFPKEGSKGWSPFKALPEPKIIPPVFNKVGSTFATAIWKSSLDALRNCRNIVVCGYSLPTTDTYMQYFLKAALGPNRKLNKIFVFDPALWGLGDMGPSLRQRYEECFSPQLKARIVFQPQNANKVAAGTFDHFVECLSRAPDSILAGLSPTQDSSESGRSVELVRRNRRNRMGGL